MPFPLIFPIVFAGTATPFDVAGDLINDAARELGLSPGTAVDPFALSDPNYIQLCGFLKSLGRDLWRKRQWSQLQKEFTFTTVQGQSAYPLPDDYGSLINQSEWNRTSQFPVAGPLSPQEWQRLRGNMAGVAFTTLFRIQQQQIFLYPNVNTPGGQVLAFEYISRWWVQSSAAAAPDKDAPTAADDVIWFDPQLVMRGLKLAFRVAKRMDSSLEQDAFDETFADAAGVDSPAPILSLVGHGGFVPLLGDHNIPETGYGG